MLPSRHQSPSGSAVLQRHFGLVPHLATGWQPAMFTEERPMLLPLPVDPSRYYHYGERTVHLDGCVGVEAGPPGWIGRRNNCCRAEVRESGEVVEETLFRFLATVCRD